MKSLFKYYTLFSSTNLFVRSSLIHACVCKIIPVRITKQLISQCWYTGFILLAYNYTCVFRYIDKVNSKPQTTHTHIYIEFLWQRHSCNFGCFEFLLVIWIIFRLRIRIPNRHSVSKFTHLHTCTISIQLPLLHFSVISNVWCFQLNVSVLWFLSGFPGIKHKSCAGPFGIHQMYKYIYCTSHTKLFKRRLTPKFPCHIGFPFLRTTDMFNVSLKLHKRRS